MRERYKKFYKKLGTDSSVAQTISEEEVAAAGAEEVFRSADAWAYILSKEPSFADKVLSFFRKSAREYSSIQGLSAQARKFVRQYKALFESLSERNQGNNALSIALEGAGAKKMPVTNTETDSMHVTGDNDEEAPIVTNTDERYALPEALKSLGEYDATRIRHIESSGKDRVVRDYNEIKDFIKRSKSNPPFERLHIGIISDKTAALVKARTGEDITGYDFVLASNFVFHIYDSHGNEATEAPRGQKAVDDANIENIIEAVIAPDDVSLVSDSTGTALRFEKFLEGRNVAITITSTKKSTLTLKSAWIINEKSGGRTPSANANALAGTPEANSRSSTDNSITENAEKSNPSDEKSAKILKKRFALPETDSEGSTLSPEQIKLTSNKNPTADPDTRYALDIENIDFSWYNEIELSAAEQARIQSEALTWDAKHRNELRRRTLTDGFTYRYIIDDEGIVHVFEREKAKNIHEWREDYGNTNTAQPDRFIEKLRSEQRRHSSGVGFAEDRRESSTDDRGDNKPLRREGRSDGAGYSENRLSSHGRSETGIQGPYLKVARTFTDITGRKRNVLKVSSSEYMIEGDTRSKYQPTIEAAIKAENERIIDRYAKKKDKSKSFVRAKLAVNPGFLNDFRFALAEDEATKHYTKEQYESFGWASKAGGITTEEIDDLFAKIKARSSLRTFRQSSKGEAIIEVNNDPHKTLGVNNVFVFVKGTKDNFRITRTVRFNVETETEMEIIKERLYERRAFSDTHLAFLEQQGFATQYTREGAKSFGEYQKLRESGDVRGGAYQNNRESGKYRSGYSLTVGEDGEIIERYALTGYEGRNELLDELYSDSSTGFDIDAILEKGIPRNPGVSALTIGEMKKTIANNTHYQVFSKGKALEVIGRI